MAKLGEVCKLNMGQSPDSSSYNDTGDGIPFFQGNADFGEVHPNIRVWCNAPTKIAHPGEILISVRAPIGAMNIADCECCIGRGLASISADEAVCTTKYLWYGISSKIEELNAKGTGSTFKAVNKKTLEETEIPIRDLMEQERIVAKLDSVTALITLRKRQVKKLDELVKARFVEMFGDLVVGDKIQTSKKKIGEIASVTKLAGFEFTKYIQYKEHGDIIMLRGLNCKQGKLILDDVKWIDRKTSDLLPRSKLYYGDILMTYAGTIGDVAMVDENDKYHLAPNVAKVSINNKKAYNPIFLMYLFLYSNDYIMRFASQVAQASINMEKIRNFEYYFPDVTFQNQFATFVERVDQQKQTVQQSLEKLELMKKALMQEYFG